MVRREVQLQSELVEWDVCMLQSCHWLCELVLTNQEATCKHIHRRKGHIAVQPLSHHSGRLQLKAAFSRQLMSCARLEVRPDRQQLVKTKQEQSRPFTHSNIILISRTCARLLPEEDVGS